MSKVRDRIGRNKMEERIIFFKNFILPCLHFLGVMPPLLLVELGELLTSSFGTISKLDGKRRQEERKKIRA